MSARGLSLLTAGFLLAVFAVPPVRAEDAMMVARSATPQTLTGEGDKTLLIDGPFGIEWQSAGRIGVSAAPAAAKAQSGGPAVISAPPKAAADGATPMAMGHMKLTDPQRYRVSIMAAGPWQVTVTW